MTATPHDPAFYAARNRPYILISAILASSLAFIDGSVVAIAIPSIRDSLGATLVQVTWINNAYLVTLAALILTGGALGDRYGQARLFVDGIGLFVTASLICALAPAPALLIVARAVQGVGAAAMVPGSLAIIARAYPRAERGRAIGVWAASSALTTAGGPLLGGVLLTFGGAEAWRWIFAINLPLGVAAIWLIRRHANRTTTNEGRVIDAPGAVLATLGLGLLAWALTSVGGAVGGAVGGEVEGGTRAAIWIAGAVGAAVLVAFVAWERRSDHPMMPPALFASATFSIANLATFTLYFGLSAVLFFLPMLVIAGWGLPPIQASLAFGPLSVFIFLFSARFGDMAARVGAGRLIATGSATFAVAYAALGALVGTQDFWIGVLAPMMLAGLGMSMVVAPLSTAVMGAVEDSQSGIASGVNNALSRIAGLVAVAAMGTVAATVYAGAGGTLSYGEEGMGERHVYAMTAAFRVIAWTASALSLASALIAWTGIPRSAAASG